MSIYGVKSTEMGNHKEEIHATGSTKEKLDALAAKPDLDLFDSADALYVASFMKLGEGKIFSDLGIIVTRLRGGFRVDPHVASES